MNLLPAYLRLLLADTGVAFLGRLLWTMLSEHFYVLPSVLVPAFPQSTEKPEGNPRAQATQASFHLVHIVRSDCAHGPRAPVALHPCQQRLLAA